MQYESDMISLVNESTHEGTRRENTCVVKHLSTCVADLRERIGQHLRVQGNHHWGTYFDIVCLSDALDIGFIVLKNETFGGIHDARGWIYGLAASRGDFSHWVLLYCESSTHFQLAALSHNNKDEQVVFAISELPTAIRHVYNINNANVKIGTSRTSGFS